MRRYIWLLICLTIAAVCLGGCGTVEDKWIGPGLVQSKIGQTTVTLRYITPQIIISDPFFTDKDQWVNLLNRYSAFYVTIDNHEKKGRQILELGTAKLHWGSFEFPLVESQFLKDFNGVDVLVNKTEQLTAGTSVNGVLVFPPIPLDLREFKVSYMVDKLKRDITFTFGAARDTRGR